MKAWAIEFRGSEGDGKLYWSGGDGEAWSNDINKAVLFALGRSAKAALDSMPLLRGRVVEVTTEGLQPVEKKNGDNTPPILGDVC